MILDGRPIASGWANARAQEHIVINERAQLFIFLKTMSNKTQQATCSQDRLFNYTWDIIENARTSVACS
jgi:hypothetical protein